MPIIVDRNTTWVTSISILLHCRSCPATKLLKIAKTRVRLTFIMCIPKFKSFVMWISVIQTHNCLPVVMGSVDPSCHAKWNTFINHCGNKFLIQFLTWTPFIDLNVIPNHPVVWNSIKDFLYLTRRISTVITREHISIHLLDSRFLCVFNRLNPVIINFSSGVEHTRYCKLNWSLKSWSHQTLPLRYWYQTVDINASSSW